jgi:shikimate kinase
MGCGKSTFGPRLAEFLALPFYDLDITFEERYRISIHDFFTKYGEKHFREIEHILLKEITKKEDFVLATGGGTPCFFNNMDFMNTHGISVYMKLTPESLVNRLKQSPKKEIYIRNWRNILKTGNIFICFQVW